MNDRIKSFIIYFSLIGCAIVFSYITRNTEQLQHVFTTIPEGLYMSIALLFGIGYALNTVAPKTAIPSFVWAIFFGMALQPVFYLFTKEIQSLHILVELLAAMVLFGGGIEVPFQSFKKHFAPIASISLAGTLLTVFLFAFSLDKLGEYFDLDIPAVAFLLMGSILASIDPAAIIPSLKELKFKKPFIKDIAISESAVNDIVGTILTRFFIVATISATADATVVQLFKPLLQRGSMDALALEVIWGILVGLFGAWILKKWAKREDRAVDPALFFAVPIFCFAGGSLIGGSGFLAAFIAGLMFNSTQQTHSVRHFFETFVDGFIKPIIFILLGAVVPIAVLISTAGIGITAAILFMFIIRPIIVFISLAPWSFSEKKIFSWRELIFISFIRETGAIPAVLILVAVSKNVAGSEYIFAIGMWIILLTLIIEPPLTPRLAKTLKILEK